MKVRLASRHLRFLGGLARCGSLSQQFTVMRTAATLGIIVGKKVPRKELTEELFNYYDVDDKTIFFLVFNHRREADSMEDAALIFSEYCGKGLDILSSLMDENEMRTITLDDILDRVGVYVAGDPGNGR